MMDEAKRKRGTQHLHYYNRAATKSRPGLNFWTYGATNIPASRHQTADKASKEHHAFFRTDSRINCLPPGLYIVANTCVLKEASDFLPPVEFVVKRAFFLFGL